MRKMIFLRIVLVLLLIGNFSKSIYLQKMPADANKLYENLAIAVKASDTTALKKVLSTTAFVKMKNEALSMGINYPADVFEGLSTILLDFKQFTYLDFKKNGATGNAYYMYGNKDGDQVVVTLWMVEENGELRLTEIKTRDAKDFITNLHRKDYSFLGLKEFQPTGVVEEVPKPISSIDYIAKYDVFGYGYEIDIVINGYKHRGVKNSTTSGTIIGGVKKGENTIVFTIKKTDPNEKEIPVIGVRAYINEKEVDVFFFNEDVQGTSITKTFTVQ